jgi:transposase InsO family protein
LDNLAHKTRKGKELRFKAFLKWLIEYYSNRPHQSLGYLAAGGHIEKNSLKYVRRWSHMVSHRTDLSKSAKIASVHSPAKSYEQRRLLIVLAVFASRQIVEKYSHAQRGESELCCDVDVGAI